MRRWLLGIAAVLALAATAAALLARAHALRSRFLMASADAIAADSELMRYALPRGRAAYAEHCSSCHGGQLQGDSARAIPNLADEDWLYGSGRVSEIERVILYGIRSGNSKGWNLAYMPAFATPHPYDFYAMAPLKPGDLEDVTTYVLSFQHPQTDAAAVERGRRVFNDVTRGNCADCHSSDAKGDTAIGAPDLTDTIWLRGDGSRDSVKDSIAHGARGHCPAWVTKLSPVTIRAIAVYVHSASAQSGRARSGRRAQLE